MAADKILLVDDERLVRWSLRQKCEEWGYQVVEADAGEPGLKLAQNESPDLVLLDVRLPDISGLEVLNQLKKSGDARAIIMIKWRSNWARTTLSASRSISRNCASPLRTR
jgi:DNA-binding response OmpR family regulator